MKRFKSIVVGAVVVGSAAVASAQTNDVTTIYTPVQNHFNQSIGIAIAAIAIGAAIMYIRKGLKARA